MPELARIARSPNYDKSAILMLIIGEKSIDIGPLGHGWDPFGDLVRAVLMVTTGGTRAAMTLPQGPIIRRLIIEHIYKEACSSTEARVLVTDCPFASLSHGRSQLFSENPTGVELDVAESLGKRWPNNQVKDAFPISHSGEIVLLDAAVNINQFARTLLQLAREMWDETDQRRFNELWSGTTRFPFQALAALDASLPPINF